MNFEVLQNKGAFKPRNIATSLLRHVHTASAEVRQHFKIFLHRARRKDTIAYFHIALCAADKDKASWN